MVLYKPKAEGEKEGRAKVIKVHPDSEGAHYTILPEGKDAKEKNTTGQRISKVCVYPARRLASSHWLAGSRGRCCYY